MKQNPTSPNSLPVLYKRDNIQPTENNPIQGAIQLWATLSDKDTAVVYQQAAGKTWLIFKQAIAVVLFLFALITALNIWVLGIAFKSGQKLRNWLEVKQPNLHEITSALLQLLASPLERAYKWAESFVKEYLRWEIKFEQTKPESHTNQGKDTK
ncbi:hypothetical protein [Calothrix sp. 336/3]